MKKLGFRWVTALAASIVMLASASCSKENGETIYLTNPALQDKAVKAGDTGNIAFKAIGTWTINNDSPEWLTLGTTTGGAGDQNITYTITDTNLAFDTEDRAIIILNTQTDKFTCTFTRAAKERAMKFYDTAAAQEESTSCEVKDLSENGEFKGRIALNSNFDWVLESYPDWVTPTVVGAEKPEDLFGAANDNTNPRTTVFFNLKDEALNTMGKDGVAVFVAKTNKSFKVTLPIKYFGTEPSQILTDSPIGAKFTADQLVYAKVEDTTPSANREIAFNVKAIKGGYKFMMINFGEWGPTVMQPAGYNTWLNIESATRAAFATQDYIMWVKANAPDYSGKASVRKAEVYLLPSTVYSQFTNPDEDMFIGDPANPDNLIVNPEFAVYLMCSVTQEAPKASIKFESDDVEIGFIGGTNDFDCYFLDIPDTGTTSPITLKVTLAATYAGLYPKDWTQGASTQRIQLATYEGENKVNILDLDIAIEDAYGDGTVYMMTIPAIAANTVDKDRSYEISYLDGENTISLLGITQAKKAQ